MRFQSRSFVEPARARASTIAFATACLVVTMGLTACADHRPPPDAPLPVLKTVGGPESVLLRFPRAGGLPRSYRWPAIDSAIWSSTDRVPPLERLLAFDDGGGMVAMTASDGRAGRIDLRNGRVQLTAKPLAHSTSTDGWSLYGINAEGRLLRNTPTSEWKGPEATADTIFALPGGNVVLVSNIQDRTAFVRFRPPSAKAIDTLELPHVSAIVRTANGDRLYAETARGILAIDTRSWKVVPGPRTGKKVVAIVPTPSGDRALILDESGRTIRIWDRYAESFDHSIALPAPAVDLRMDPLGRFLLARTDVADSAYVISIPLQRVIRTVATDWRADLPTVSPDGSVLTLHQSDVIAIDPATGARRQRVRGGGQDIWMLVRWDGFRPRDSLLDAPATFASETPADSAAAVEAVDSALAARAAAEAISREHLDSIARASMTRRTRPDSESTVYTLSFASLLSEATALSLAKSIRVSGRSPRVVVGSRDGIKIYRVVLGPYRTKELAEAAGKRSGVPYWVYAGVP